MIHFPLLYSDFDNMDYNPLSTFRWSCSGVNSFDYSPWSTFHWLPWTLIHGPLSMGHTIDHGVLSVDHTRRSIP